MKGAAISVLCALLLFCATASAATTGCVTCNSAWYNNVTDGDQTNDPGTGAGSENPDAGNDGQGVANDTGDLLDDGDRDRQIAIGVGIAAVVAVAMINHLNQDASASLDPKAPPSSPLRLWSRTSNDDITTGIEYQLAW